jgi:hypothetical protein
VTERGFSRIGAGLAGPAGFPLQGRIGISKVNAGLTCFRDLGPVKRDFGMSTRVSIGAIAPGADQARPAAALILGGLLLLISP